MQAIALRRLSVYAELAKQVRRIVESGLQPTHLDTHKHTHLLPPVLDAVARISEEFHIPWVRRPFDFPIEAKGAGLGKRLVSGAFGVVRPYFKTVLTRHRCRMTDHFAGFRITGNYDAPELARLIERLPEGTTEFMCHPGYCTGELRATPTRLLESRERELAALKSPLVRTALRQANIELANYR